MRKLFFTIVMAAVSCLMVQANPVSRDEAMQKARQQMAWLNDGRTLTAVTAARMAPGQRNRQQPLYHVFNRGVGGGYIIISGDDQTEEVLGYCDTGSFDYGQLPPAMQEWLNGCAAQIEQLQKAGSQASPAKSPRRGIIVRDAVGTHPAVPQLMDCTWNQGSPYNDECPMYFTLGRSVTGCVATAMAQILYYNREKSVTETQAAIPAYDTWTQHPTYGSLHVEGIPAGSPLDWDNMLPSYNGSTTSQQRKAVAQLMHYCGVSVKMDYTNSASGAQSSEVANALPKYFGYGSSVRYVSASSYSDSDWDNLIYNEVANARAVYLSGANASVGHAFVCDGYDGNRRYHINWGWGGTSNGYYLLTNLTPGEQGIGGSDNGYNSYRDAIIGIEPVNYLAKTMSFNDATARQLAVGAFDTDGDGALTYGEAAAVTSLGDVFRGSNMKNFSELHYFTGLTAIDDSAFIGCTKLATIRLPKNVTKIGKASFSGCSSLSALVLPEALNEIGASAFEGCQQLASLELPQGLATIQAATFKDCSRLSEVNLPISVISIGSEAYANCAALKTFRLNTIEPQLIQLGSGVFAECSLANATLITLQGTKGWLTGADQWKEFGQISEVRDLTRGQFVPLETGKTYFIYNVGTGRFLTKGEAWGTQAVVGTEPMRFVINHGSSMPEGVYYLTSEDTGKDGRYLFRTSTDGNVGTGVKAAFVDGTSLTNNARWQIMAVEGAQNTYTMQVPASDASHVADQFFGPLASHKSNAAMPTNGVYWDIPYAQWQQNCHWRLVAYDADAYELYKQSVALGNLLSLAVAKHFDVSKEQAVYDNMDSTLDEVMQAQRSLREKLSLIHFADATARRIFTSNFDLDTDGEISYVEASKVNDLGYSFYSSAVETLDELKYFTSLTQLYGNSFENCKQLKSITLPKSLETMYYRVFYGCSSLTELTLPAFVTYIGDNNFDGCTRLRVLRVENPDPASITLGENVFRNVPVRNDTLYVPFGSRDLYANAPVWKNFGTILEMRTDVAPRLSAPQENVSGYIYNVATRKFLNKGEAYGTQSVVARQGLIYQIKRTKSMPEGTYYLVASSSGSADKTVLFRTDTDSKVGEGVKACFVDGNLSSKGYWQMEMVGDTLFTLQVPENDETRVEGEYLGTQSNHASDVASPTNGAYYDVTYEGHERQCQWAFVTLQDMQEAGAMNNLIAKLRDLLQLAQQREVDAADEQAVYDNPEATLEQMQQAINSLREKFHYITFGDNSARDLCLKAWDADGDNELTFEEAAAVTDLGNVFQGNSNVVSLEELRYFTSLQTIGEKAFFNCSSLVSIYLPAGVNKLEANVFQYCNKLKYVAVLSASVPEGFDDSRLSSRAGSAQFFVPAAMIDSYQADSQWGKCSLEEYTGVPVVTADSVSRQYGRSVARFTYTVSGAPINGTPVLDQPLAKEASTPVGDYPVSVTSGDITSAGLVLRDGVLTILPAQLTITAKSYERNEGEPNPEFEVTFRGFRNNEKKDVLTVQPTVTCEATIASPAGEYPIVVSGAEAQNYEIVYVNGVLTIGSTGISDNSELRIMNSDAVYDLQGRKYNSSTRQLVNSSTRQLKKGLYISAGKKRVVKK